MRRWKMVLAGSIALSGCASVRRTDDGTGIRDRSGVCRTSCASAPLDPPEYGATVEPSDYELHRLERVARRSMPSVVRIHTAVRSQRFTDDNAARSPDAPSQSGGTGVVVASGGVILTSAHVLRNAIGITVELSDGSKRRVERVAVDRHLDLAVIRVRDHDLDPLPFTDALPETGSCVVAISLPRGDGASLFRPGVVTNPSVSFQDELDPAQIRYYGELIESTTRIQPGFSGGPLLDLRGRLVGLNVAVSGPVGMENDRGYAIPFDKRTQQTIERLIKRAGAVPHLPER